MDLVLDYSLERENACFTTPEHLAAVSVQFQNLAISLVAYLDGPELKAGLRKLLESKDCMVRAALDLTESTAPYEGRHEERGGILSEPDPANVPEPRPDHRP